MAQERRSATRFTEKLSTFMVMVAAAGAFFVLADPKMYFQFWGQSITIDGVEFSADLKGAVIFAILIGGWVAVKEYWLGASEQGKDQARAMSQIAAAAPAAAKASADQALGIAMGSPASTVIKPVEPAPIVTENLVVSSENTVVNPQEQKP